MIYLDYGATSFPKPAGVYRGVLQAMTTCASPGRGGYPAAMEAAKQVFACREQAARLFSCDPEQVVFTSNCTHGLNIAIRSLVKPGGRVVISGFEHNAVTRPLYALGGDIQVAGRKLFDWQDTLTAFDRCLTPGVQAAVVTHVSNVFGYILPVEQIAALCRMRGIPLIVDAAQSAGTLPVDFSALGARFIAMPGHKGLLGPQGTGILLCAQPGEPLLYGGTGTASLMQTMPEDLPERQEAGTVNVPGIVGLCRGMEYVQKTGLEQLYRREHRQLKRCAAGLRKLGMQVFSGEHQAATLSFRPGMDCEEAAAYLAQRDVAVRAGLHCAPLAHQSAGTETTGTVRVSFGWASTDGDTAAFLRSCAGLPGFRK